MQQWKLIVHRSDGHSYESIFSGYHGETASDYYFNEAKADKRTVFAVTIVMHPEGDILRQFHVPGYARQKGGD